MLGNNIELDPYLDGYNAATRSKKYARLKYVPQCPFPFDSEEGLLWQDGFSDGTQDLITDKNLNP